MEYLAVSIYTESFAGTCLKKSPSYLIIYVYAYGLGCKSYLLVKRS
jgi:hypothetical protein